MKPIITFRSFAAFVFGRNNEATTSEQLDNTKQKKVNYMSKKSVFCIAASRHQADQIADHLKTESFSNRDISVLFSDAGASGDVAHEKNIKAQEGPLAGGALSWIAGIGPLAITGIGPCRAAGPVMAALSGGAAVGGIAGGLIGLGIPELEARGYEGKVKEGKILLSVHTEDIGDIARAKDIFQQARAQDIYTTASARKENKNTTAKRPVPAAERSFSA